MAMYNFVMNPKLRVKREAICYHGFQGCETRYNHRYKGYNNLRYSLFEHFESFNLQTR